MHHEDTEGDSLLMLPENTLMLIFNSIMCLWEKFLTDCCMVQNVRANRKSHYRPLSFPVREDKPWVLQSTIGGEHTSGFPIMELRQIDQCIMAPVEWEDRQQSYRW